jgi:hypothetical protein
LKISEIDISRFEKTTVTMAPPAPPSQQDNVDVEAEVGNQTDKYNWKLLSIDEQQKAIESLIDESEDLVESAAIELEDARELVRKAGLSIETSNTSSAAPADSTYMPAVPVATTGGYSNTDHVVLQTGDPVTDRIEELKRNQWLRYVRNLASSSMFCTTDGYGNPHLAEFFRSFG